MLAEKHAASDTIGFIDTMLLYYGVTDNPDELSDNEWALRITHLKQIRKMEAENKGVAL